MTTFILYSLFFILYSLNYIIFQIPQLHTSHSTLHTEKFVYEFFKIPQPLQSNDFIANGDFTRALALIYPALADFTEKFVYEFFHTPQLFTEIAISYSICLTYAEI